MGSIDIKYSAKMKKKEKFYFLKYYLALNSITNLEFYIIKVLEKP